MKETRDIVERWRMKAGKTLASLARVQGSSYRRSGAKLLVCNDGSFVGSISAGCLEGVLLRKSAWLTRNGATVETFSTLYDDATEMPFGLGCGGVLDVLLEPVDTPECQALFDALEQSLLGSEKIVATWLPSPTSPLQRAIFDGTGQLHFASTSLWKDQLTAALRACYQESSSSPPAEFTVDRLTPPQRLVIFGAGDDARPLASMADALGWSVLVADSRSHLAREDRFPSSARVLVSIQQAAAEIQQRDAVVVMTHSFEQDRDALAAVLPHRPRYLGLLGARHRSALLISTVADDLGLTLDACCDQVTAPIGLDIGGEGPEAIALAIMAEAQLVCAGKGNTARRLSAEQVQGFLQDAPLQAFPEPLCSLSIA